MKKLQEKQIRLGVCYYPEHWSEEIWEDDFKRMKNLGFTYVRMGEFAWTIFEPEEGTFSFALFDKAIDLAHNIGLKVIMGYTYSYTPCLADNEVSRCFKCKSGWIILPSWRTSPLQL